MQLQDRHAQATNPASTTKIVISTSRIPLQPIRVISNPPRRNTSWVFCPALARMFKELAALRVLHGFPELLYFRVGHQGSLTKLLEEDFSCFIVLVPLTHGFGWEDSRDACLVARDATRFGIVERSCRSCIM